MSRFVPTKTYARVRLLWTSFDARYRRVFALHEIEANPLLQWMFGGLLVFFFAVFTTWNGTSYATIESAEKGTAVCWPYFQSCYKLFFLNDLSHGYSQSIFYMGLYTLMVAIIWAMWRKQWSVAHFSMSLLLVWEALISLVFSYEAAGPYNYYHIALVAILLYAREKEFFLKLAFVWMYFMSVTTKFDSTWILGTYFSPLKYGLPLFPDILIPLITNLVIFMQTIGAWFLLSRNKILQRIAFFYFLAFHLYSGVFVQYLYPSVSVPALLILFGPLYSHTPIPFSSKTFVGWTVIALLAVFQILGVATPGDRRMSLENNKFGMFMFEANHQCVITVDTHTKEKASTDGDAEFESRERCGNYWCLMKRFTRDGIGGGSVREERYESSSSRQRCYPYIWWSRLHLQCDRDSNIERIAMRIDHSINGGPFYRIIDEPDMCALDYNAFSGNTWIREPPEAPLVGYPVQNAYSY